MRSPLPPPCASHKRHNLALSPSPLGERRKHALGSHPLAKAGNCPSRGLLLIGGALGLGRTLQLHNIPPQGQSRDHIMCVILHSPDPDLPFASSNHPQVSLHDLTNLLCPLHLCTFCPAHTSRADAMQGGPGHTQQESCTARAPQKIRQLV